MKIYVSKSGTNFVIQIDGQYLFGNDSNLNESVVRYGDYFSTENYDLVYKGKQKVGESYAGQDIEPVNEMILADPYSNQAYCYVESKGWQITGQKESDELDPDIKYKIIYLPED